MAMDPRERSERYRARKLGIAVPKMKPGPKPGTPSPRRGLALERLREKYAREVGPQASRPVEERGIRPSPPIVTDHAGGFVVDRAEEGPVREQGYGDFEPA